MAGTDKGKKNNENGLANIAFNIIIPVLLLTKSDDWFGLSPTWSLILALMFPVCYGVYYLIISKKYNFFSILGVISILLTGGIGLLKLPKEWVAIKEAAVPLAFGIAVLISLRTKYPLVRMFFYNKQIIQVDKVDDALQENGKRTEFNKLLKECTYLLAASFLLSAVLNYTLAKIIIKSETGTQAFTEELGKLTGWSFPMIALPCTLVMVFGLWKLIKGVESLTGLDFDSIFKAPEKKSKA